MRRAIVAVVVAALLAGCASLGGARQGERYFVLDVVAPRAAQAAVAVTPLPTSAASFYDTQDIVYSREPGTRAYYQFSRWTERPQRAVHAALAARLGAGAAGGPLLATHLEEIYHDASRDPGTVHVALTAQLVDPASRAVIARRRFERTAPAAAFSAPGAVAGLRAALAGLLDDLEAWVAERLSR